MHLQGQLVIGSALPWDRQQAGGYPSPGADGAPHTT